MIDNSAKVLAGVLLIVTSTAACAHENGNGKAQSVPEPPIGPISVLQDTKTLVLPLDSYLPGVEQETAITRARGILLTRCMARYGFSYHDPVGSSTGASSGHARIYGVTDLSTAHRYGFHPPEGTQDHLTYPPDSALSGQKEAVFNGTVGQLAKRTVPRGGCSGEADRALHKGTDVKLRTVLPEELQGEASGQAQADSRVRAVFGKWSSCMKTRGYSYQDPPSLMKDDSLMSAQPTQREISTAVADVTCKQKVNVIGVWSTVEAAYENRLIEKNATILAEIKSSWSTQVKNAEALITGQDG